MLENYTEWITLCDELDRLSSAALCKVSFDLDAPFQYNGDSSVYAMVHTCLDGVKDKLFNPLGCTVRFDFVKIEFKLCLFLFNSVNLILIHGPVPNCHYSALIGARLVISSLFQSVCPALYIIIL